MALDFKVLEKFVTVYGTPLYPTTPQIVAGVVNAGEYTIEGNTLRLLEDGKTYYINIRTSRFEQGVDETQSFTIGLFPALRDSSGEYNGKAWSVTKGELKPFAY